MKLAGTVALVYVLISTYLRPVAAAIVNRTIDDQFGDSVTGLLPIYSPATGVWDNQTCSGCAIKADVTQAFKGTYSAATYNPGLTSMGISMQFNGTAIYVFFILANNQGDGITTLTRANFSVDGKAAVTFTHTPDLSTTAIQYNALVFSQSNLSNSLHKLDITTAGSVNIYVNFDYAIYTHDDTPLVSSSQPSATSSPAVKHSTTAAQPTTTGTKTRSSGTPIIPIVGGVVGGIVVVALVILLLLCWPRRRAGNAPRKNAGTEGIAPLITESNNAISPSASAPVPWSAQLPVQLTASMVSQPGGVRVYSARGAAGSLQPNTENLYGGIQNSYETISDGDAAHQSDMRDNYQTLPSGQIVLSPPGSASLPSLSATALAFPTPIPSRHGAGDGHRASPPLPSRNFGVETQEDIRRARQEELDNRLRMVQQEMQEMQGLRSDLRTEKAGPGRWLSLRRQRTGTAQVEVVEGEGDMSVSDMKEEIRSMKEQIRLLREQQRSPWAQGLSDDPPPGYTPTEMRTRNSRDVLLS